MFPFWDLVMAPVLDAVHARRIVEIGALRGDNTVKLLNALGPEAELHVIDPLPAFDPAEHEQAFPGRYLFHRALSLDVLEDLAPMDVALIDGDHNWYTVYHEARMLASVARAADAPLPVMIFHDVAWPYGRRDLYYDPDTIPAEFRQPYERKGIPLRGKGLVDRGGLNPTLCNAVTSGGPRNGVMTGIEDFVLEYDKPLRHLVLPIYFGLSVVVEEERLEAVPALREVFDHLESADGRAELLELSEATRLESVHAHHRLYFNREKEAERSASRYLDLLKAALLDEHYLENELRIRYLAACIERGVTPDARKLADPVRTRRQWRHLLGARRSGVQAKTDTEIVPAYFPATTMGRARLDDLQACLDTIRTESVDGDLVECGTGRGGGATFLAGYLKAWNRGEPGVWIADRFRASPDELTDPGGTKIGGGAGFPDFQPDLNTVRELLDRFEVFTPRIRFLQGRYSETLADAGIEKIALLRLGETVGDEAGDVLDALYDAVAVGGFIVVDGHSDPHCRKAVREFRRRRGVDDPIERIDWSAIRWRKTSVPSVSSLSSESTPENVVSIRARAGTPPVDRGPVDVKDLTVVVVFYNMKREAERTLHSLSRAYQQQLGDLDYEVIAVDNGSSGDQRLGEGYVTSFGPEFTYVDMGPDASSSPVLALNTGIAMGTGNAFGLMIDGAHVLTPGVLHFGVTGLETYDPAIVMTQQWYVGPGQQPTATANGYNQDLEDGLFEKVDWPRDGYALFDIGHFIGERDWFDGMWESNCLFVPRKLLAQVGAFEEGFATPGGGYANLELYERLASSPDVKVATILGEGSFHQVHGGTTTNVEVANQRNQDIARYAEEFEALRGRPYQGPARTMHYVGTMSGRAMRTKGRRRVAAEFWSDRGDRDAGVPESPQPIPDEMRNQYTEAVWENLAWKRTTWLGASAEQLPSDLFIYQEIIHRVRPDWVIDIDSGPGGRTLFLASILDLVGRGRVLSLLARDSVPQHDRIERVRGGIFGDKALSRVRDLVGDKANAMVVLGARHPVLWTMRAFDRYSEFVPKDSYVIIEDTIVNGHPVWPEFGPGPAEASNRIVAGRGDFAPDTDLEKYGLTLNQNGYLRRFR